LPEVDETRRTRASAWRGLAAAAVAQGDGAQAEAASRTAMALYDPGTWFRADTAVDGASALIAQRRFADADPLLNDALALFAADDPRTRRAVLLLADAYAGQGGGPRLAELQGRYATFFR